MGTSSTFVLMFDKTCVISNPVRYIAIFVLFQSSLGIYAQQDHAMIDEARNILSGRGEVIVKFTLPAGYDVNYFSSVMSVDNVTGDTVIAYMNQRQFDRFQMMEIPFRVIPPPSLKHLKTSLKEKGVMQLPDGYPSYDEYIDMMENFAADYDEICRLVEFGQSIHGRKLLTLKITDQPDTREQEPAFLYTSTMHGDEVVGYVLMLCLIEELLTGYETDTRIKNLVDHVEIWINPLANPDGTYFLSDESVYGAARYNANGVDLNRNFPDPEAGDHPDGNEWQTETLAMINFLKSIPFSLAANFHDGEEVVNYPWDTWSRLHADDLWYREISRAYADTVHQYSPEGYMTFKENGITNGYAWYAISGGRQDYSNYFLHGREVTIELSNEKVPDESTLPEYWEYNKRSMLDYMEQVMYGISGVVTDSITGNPLRAKIGLAGHDSDHSEVYSSADNGLFFRLIDEGSYLLTCESVGYQKKSFSVNVPYHDRIELDISLTPIMLRYKLFPNPFRDGLYVYITDGGGEMRVEVYNISGRMVISDIQPVDVAGRQYIDLRDLAKGLYIIQIVYKDFVIRDKIIKM